jgi:hypothetical protein
MSSRSARRRVELSAATAAREQRNPSDEGFQNSPSSVEGERGPRLFKVTVGEDVGKLGCAEDSELLVHHVELAVEACGDQLILAVTAPPSSRLGSGVGDEILLLQGLNCSDLDEERLAFVGDGAASG